MLIGSWGSELLVIAAAGAAGWFLAAALAWLTDCVTRPDGDSYRLCENFLVRDPLLQAAVAATWMILTVGGLSWQVGAAALVSVPLVQVAVADLRSGYVYTVVGVSGIALSV